LLEGKKSQLGGPRQRILIISLLFARAWQRCLGGLLMLMWAFRQIRRRETHMSRRRDPELQAPEDSPRRLCLPAAPALMSVVACRDIQRRPTPFRLLHQEIVDGENRQDADELHFLPFPLTWDGTGCFPFRWGRNGPVRGKSAVATATVHGRAETIRKIRLPGVLKPRQAQTPSVFHSLAWFEEPSLPL